MGIEDVRSAVVLGFLLSFMVGPVFFVLLETAATRGFRAGLILDLGVVLGDVVFILVAYFSSYQLLDNLSNEPGLYVFGGTILVLYGMILLFRRDEGKADTKLRTRGNDYIGLFVKGFLLNIINVGVLIFWLGITIVVGPGLDGDGYKIGSFFMVVILTYLAVDIGKILLAKQLRSRLTPVRILWIKRVLGVLLVISGCVLISRGYVTENGFIERGLEIMEKESPD